MSLTTLWHLIREWPPLQFVYPPADPHRFRAPVPAVKTNVSGSGLRLIFKNGLRWQIWLPSTVGPLPPSFERRGEGGWLGVGDEDATPLPNHPSHPTPLQCPLISGLEQKLLWHEARAAVSMVTSRLGSTSFARRTMELWIGWLFERGRQKEKKTKTLNENLSPHYVGWRKTALIWQIGC